MENTINSISKQWIILMNRINKSQWRPQSKTRDF